MEKFDPSNLEYKKVEDLPKEQQKRYINHPDGGFVMKTVIEGEKDAELEADDLNKNRSFFDKISGQNKVDKIDILQDIAIKDNEAFDLANKFLEVTGLLNQQDIKSHISIGEIGVRDIRDSFASSFEFILGSYSKEEVSDFINKLADSKQFIAEMQKTPRIVGNIYQIFKNQDVLTDSKKLSNFAYNVNLRQQEHLSTYQELRERVRLNSLASEEELNAGVYREDIEPQVREVVFALRSKGYNTFNSGFGNLISGEQYISFDKTNIGETLIVPDNLVQELLDKNISLKIKRSGGRHIMSLIPKGDFPSLEEWKNIWTIVADLMPKISDVSAVKNIAGNAPNYFRERQKKIKKGEDVYLGYGLQLKNGTVMPKE